MHIDWYTMGTSFDPTVEVQIAMPLFSWCHCCRAGWLYRS